MFSFENIKTSLLSSLFLSTKGLTHGIIGYLGEHFKATKIVKKIVGKNVHVT
jgi:hypothetical protein